MEPFKATCVCTDAIFCDGYPSHCSRLVFTVQIRHPLVDVVSMTVIESGYPVLESFLDLSLIPLIFISKITTRAFPSGFGLAGILNYLVSNFIPDGILELAILYVIGNLVCSQFKIR